MGVINRAYRNISRRKIRALLVVIALGFSLAIMISIPAGIAANQTATQALTQNLSNAIAQTGENLNSTIAQTEATINQTLMQIDCSLTPSAPQGFGFTRGNFTFNPGQFGGMPPDFNFTPGQFGGQFAEAPPGEFGAGPFGGSGSNPMNETYYNDLGDIPNVAAIAPVLQVTEGHNVTVSTPFGGEFTRMTADYIIEGIPLTSELVGNYPILPSNITEGRNFVAGDSGAVILSENNSAYFNAGVGDTITILGQDFQVVGIHGSSGVSDTLTLYMNLSDAQTITNNVGYATTIYVFTNTSADVSDVATAISALHPELDVTTSQQRLEQLQNLQSTYQTQLDNSQSIYETQLSAAQTTMNQTNTQAFQEIIVAIAATSLIVLFVMLYTVRERTKEIGTLKAIGFSNWTVMSQFLLEGVLLSLVAGVVAIAIGSIAAPFLSSLLLPSVGSSVNLFGNAGTLRVGGSSFTASTVSTASLSPELMLMTLGLAVLLGALGSLYPAWRAAKTRPAEAMRYE
jgi:ABC-type antimicrobial peptide transport system permease subunit